MISDKVICIIRSPFQLLCLYEFLSQNLITEYECHIILNSEKEKDQCFKIKKLFKFNFFSIKVVNSIIQIFRLQMLFKNCNTLIIGHLFDNICVISSKLISYNNLIILDDGVSSLAIKDKIFFNKSPYDNFLGLKQNIFDFFVNTPKKFSLFTIFYDHLELSDNIKVIPNNFNFLTSNIKFEKNDCLVYFIGTPVVENGLVSKTNFNNFFKNIKENNIMYFPHRREKIENLKFLESLGIKLCFSNIPFELFLLDSKKLPSKIISFSSSVLFTSRSILKNNFNKVDFYYIELNDFVTEKKIDNHLIKIQDFYKTLGYNKIIFYAK